MISLFLKGNTNFNNNGYVLNEWIKDSVKITESTDGIFDFDGEYPIQDTKNFSKFLVRGNIIRCPVYDSRPDQLFRIRKSTIDSSNNKISVYAQAIARCDLMNDFVFGGGDNPVVPSGKTRKEAVSLVLSASQDNNSIYHVGNLDTSTNTNINLGIDENTGDIINYIDVSYVSPLAGILDNSDGAKSIYNAYGGEIIFNNFEINMVDERGNDNEFTIKSGKNLQEFQQEIDDTSDDFATVLIMKSSDGIYLPNNEVIESPNVSILGKKWKVVSCEDVKAADDTTDALNVVYDQLRERGQKKFADDGIDQLTINNTVKFAQLKKTEQYKDYAILEKCELGNNVTIVYSKLNNYTAKARITQIVYNPLALNGQGKITEVTIGNRKKTSIVNTINSTSSTVSVTTDKVNSVVQAGSDSSTWKMSENAFKECCIGSSNGYTEINESGLTVYNGKILVKNSNGSVVFTVTTDGRCSAVGGFVVEDGNTNCNITADEGLVIENDKYKCQMNDDGVRITNLETGYTGLITVDDVTRLNIPDDLNIGKTLSIGGFCDMKSNLHVAGDGHITGSLDLEGTLTVGGQTLEEIIDSRIPKSSGSSDTPS